MNVELTFDNNVAKAQLVYKKAEVADIIKHELDEIFKSKISTPEQVIETYKKLEQFRYYAGEEYKITFKENTIV